ncbi:hypothetical protein [Sphingopyxis sp.]|jgi:uncharacterized membrane protein|uniref:hypothetical protein n=1 Tax=Sphingopyxis sp. TaxID=1908224 RepID=UPI002DF772F4|nr:hypothetical protein [Sphingopyxis sp.]
MTDTRPVFAAWHRADRAFFLSFIAMSWLGVAMGFAPQIAKRFGGTADYPAPAMLEIHVWAFFAWMAILTVQALLIGARRHDLHRLLGLSIVILVPVMTVSAIAAEIHSQRFYAPRDPENARFFALPLTSMILFAGTATLAFVKRGYPAAHKRLILLATAVILSAAFGRWWGEPIGMTLGDGYGGIILGNWAGTIALIVAAALFDIATRGRVHPVLLWGGGAYALAFAAAAVAYHSDWWPAWVRGALGLAAAA